MLYIRSLIALRIPWRKHYCDDNCTNVLSVEDWHMQLLWYRFYDMVHAHIFGNLANHHNAPPTHSHTNTDHPQFILTESTYNSS